MSKSYIKDLLSNGFIVIDLPFSAPEKKIYVDKLSNHFEYAFKNKETDEKYIDLIKRPDLGSFLIDTNSEIEILLKNVVSRSLIVDLAKELWECDVLYYASKFSHFRYVDPNVPAQMTYQNLHQDISFLNTKSLNICIPSTGYGNSYPGIEFFTGLDYLPDEDDFNQHIIEEPFVEIGQALIFHELTPHRRTVNNKTKIRINTEFRIFPSLKSDSKNIFGLRQI